MVSLLLESQRETTKGMRYDESAQQIRLSRDIGRTIPHVFKKNIAIDELASAKGTFATLTIEVDDEKSRLMGYRIAKLKTKAGETVTFPFGTQRDSTPSRAGEEIEGQVFLLESGSFDENEFPKGPPGKDSKIKITGGNL
jgi:hypothetical protein